MASEPPIEGSKPPGWFNPARAITEIASSTSRPGAQRFGASCPADPMQFPLGSSGAPSQLKKVCRYPPDDSPEPELRAEVKDLSKSQPGDNPQTDCAHHQQHSVHSARIRALL